MQEALEANDLVKINRDYLTEGKDMEGGNLPPYASPDYANFKTSINPRNRGFWDLRVSGEYYRGLRATVYPSVVFFSQTVQNEKVIWIHSMLEFYNNAGTVGISEKTLLSLQEKNIPDLQKKLFKIINH